jgi:predicted site-specific integrase-resolvase
MIMPNIDEVMLPEEAAHFLGISTQKLSRLRRQGRIHGTQVGQANLYTYTIADLKHADLRPRKRGRKRKNVFSSDTNIDREKP